MQHFRSIFYNVSDDLVRISNYLTSGMLALHRVSQNVDTDNLNKSCAQAVCIVSAMVWGDIGIPSTSLTGLFATQKTRHDIAAIDCRSQ
jgi:hypothetical protein